MTAVSPRPNPLIPLLDGDLRALFGQSTAVFASLSGSAHVVEAANPAFFAAIGGPERTRTGEALAELMPELEEQGIIGLLDDVFRSGRPYTARDARVVLGTGPAAREAFFDFTYEPRRDPTGAVAGIRVIGVETTQSKHAQLLMAEQRALLEQIVRQAPLAEILDGMARAIEALAPDQVLVSVLLADRDGTHLRHGAAPSLPAFYNEAIDGIATGEGIGSCGTAAHRRQTVTVSDIATDPLWVDFRELAARAGLAACWSTPLIGRDGAVLDTFAMYHRTPRSPRDNDLALARVFADTAVLAIERHRIEEAKAAAEADLSFLLTASTELGADLDYLQTLQRLATACSPVLAPLAIVDIVDGPKIRRVATAAPTAREEDLLAGHLPDFDGPDSHVSHVSHVLASSAVETGDQIPADRGPWRQLGVTAYLCVPLLDRGQAFGVLTLLTTGDRPFDRHTIALTEDLARRAALAVHNSRQYTERAAMARDLQAGLLPPQLPPIPRLDVAAHYRPAGEGLDVGGDFYDLFPLADNQWAFILGDVCGRGALAAATTATVRHTARAVAPLLPKPDMVVRAINRALLDRPNAQLAGFVTLVYGRLQPTTAGIDIELVRAGHTLPLLLDRQHTVRPIDAAGALLGVTGTTPPTTRSLRLRPGESLVLYTDGLTEVRNRDGEQFGDRRLVEVLEGMRPSRGAAEIVDRLTASVRDFARGKPADDDQALLVLTATAD
ncbi:SpoIIE family protein phosphatase [Mangrovihabitans endophyticus]|uniref:Serine phosphatase RsbU, regulator of sigma subunit n=1 Tax=Mangrovihabitans endophyticus TaxID=1751298 RepID=A0A8J3FRH2_9ACTN|nr:SpoIIE family protein phosphatase [Mangrovihabitans endophyticus]GGL11668.1 hypothetical protein GCM10012284_53000 [Mangrovihabitans endophyticus]